jgi:hypothetical protein
MKPTPIDSDALIVEIMRYLAAVDAFRAEHCEPTWRPELEGSDPVIVRIGAYGQTATPAGS